MATTRWKLTAAVAVVAAALAGGTAVLLPGAPEAPAADPAPAQRAPAEAEKSPPGRVYVQAQLPPTLAGLITGGDGTSRILSIDPETAKWTAVGDNGGFVRVAPDRRTLLFTRGDAVWRGDAEGRGEPRRLCEQRGRPVWSPDGKHFVVTRQEELRGGDGWSDETWRYDADGTGATKLPVPDTDAVEDWSPDGRWFVTCSDRHPPRGRGYQLYRMHPDGTGQQRLTRGAGLNCYARFSRDGRRLVYLHQERGVNSLHVMDADGGNDREVLRDRGRDCLDSACWSPDGRRLAVVLLHRPKPGAIDLFGNPLPVTYSLDILDADGGNRRELTLRRGKDVVLVPRFLGHPDWR